MEHTFYFKKWQETPVNGEKSIKKKRRKNFCPMCLKGCMAHLRRRPLYMCPLTGVMSCLPVEEKALRPNEQT